MKWSNISPKPFVLLWIRVALRFTLMMTSWFPRPGDGSSAHTLWTRDHSLNTLHPSRQGWKKTKFWHVCLSTLICVHALLVGSCQKALQKLISWVGGLSVYCLNLALMVPCLRDQEWSGAFGGNFFCGRELRFVKSPLFLGGGSTSIWVIMFCSHVCTSQTGKVQKGFRFQIMLQRDISYQGITFSALDVVEISKSFNEITILISLVVQYS